VQVTSTAAIATLDPKQPGQREQIAKAAGDYEAMFVGQLMQLMMDQVPTDGPFGGGHAEGIYRSMMAQEMAKDMMRRGGIGLQPTLMNELLKLQGGGQ
jgi:peptidoglycan hydrolase FlgJ